MTTACVCIELRLLVPKIISVSCIRARFYVVGFLLYTLSYYCLYVLSPCCGVRYNFRKRLFCWCLSLLFVVQFMSYCDVCLRILVSNIMLYHGWCFIYKRQELFTFREHLHGSPPVVVICVANYFFISFCYVCIRLVACVLKDASISVLPILD